MKKEKLVDSANLQCKPLEKEENPWKKADFIAMCLQGLHCEALLTFKLDFDQTSLHFLKIDLSQHFPSKQGSN